MLACLCGSSDGSRVLDAAKTGDVQAIIDLLKKKPKLAHTQQWGGQTAWHLAARDGHADVLQAMADTIQQLSAVELQQLSSQGRTAEKIITHLAQEGDTKCLTPLHLACIKGHAEAAGLLMKLGVNPFLMDSVGRTALHYAASWGHADCINAILSAHSGPPKPEWRVSWPNDEDTRLVDVQNMSGFTPLHYAVWVGRTEAIQALASYDASLEVVNNANDYDWIKVGAGNTPLHLAAFGGDFDVVKLLLAAHVQTLAAGAEVMAAGQGQWGQRYANDVRHMRNRRGLMAYHIAVHKHFQHLTELLHPDIPYTFIFSNDDMDVGSVRMYGPARLMVIAAKALQQKLISELEAVEQAAATSPKAAAAAAKDAGAAAAASADPVLVAAATGSSVASVPGSSVRESDLQQQQQDPREAAAAAAEADTSEDAAAEVGSPTGELPLLSPFAAKSHKHWTSTSTGVDNSSIASATPASSLGACTGGPAAAAAGPTAAGQATSLISDTDQSLASAAAAAAADAITLGASGDVVKATALVGAPVGALAESGGKQAGLAFEIHAANARVVKGDAEACEPVSAECSFAVEAGEAAGGLDASNTAPATLLARANSSKGIEGRQPESSFTGFGTCAAAAGASGAVQQQYSHYSHYGSAASDAGASAISSSTIPGSTSAVAGTPAGSIIVTSDYASVASSTRGGYASSNKTAAPGSPVGNMLTNNIADRSYGNRVESSGIQQATSNDAAAAAANGPAVKRSSCTDSAGPHSAAAAAAAPMTARGAGLHNTALPENGAAAASNSEAPRHMRHRRVQSTVEQQTYGRQGSRGHARRATAEGLDNRRSGWLQSMGSFSRMHTRRDLDDILPPSAIVTTAADDDSSSITKQQQQQQRRSSIGQPSRFSAAGAVPRSSSMRASQDCTRRASITEQGETATQNHGDVAVQQQSNTAGALQEQGSTDCAQSPGACVQDNPLDIMLANRASRIGESPEAMRQQLVLMKLASGMLNFQTAVTAFNAAQVDALDALQGNSATGGALGRRPHAALSFTAMPSTELPAELAVPAGTGATAAAATADPAAADAQHGAAMSADNAAGRSSASGAAQLTKSNSLAALRNNSCRSMIAKQPSLKRLMSGMASRGSLVTALKVSEDNVVAAAAEVAVEMAAAAAAPAGGSDVGSLHSTPATTATGELPIIQQRTRGTARMITEEDECDSDADECEVCFDAHAVVRLQECGHTLCVGCCKEMCKLHHFKPALCPYCRQIICGFALQKSS